MSALHEQLAAEGLLQIGATTAHAQLDSLAQQAAAHHWSYSHLSDDILNPARIASKLLLPKEECCLIINVTNGNDFRRTNKMEVIHECFNDGASAPGTSGGVAAAIRGSNTGREG
jgi:hypothetical protein